MVSPTWLAKPVAAMVSGEACQSPPATQGTFSPCDWMQLPMAPRWRRFAAATPLPSSRYAQMSVLRLYPGGSMDAAMTLEGTTSVGPT